VQQDVTVNQDAEESPGGSRSGVLQRFEAIQILGLAVAALIVAALIFSVVELSSQHGKIARLENLQSLQRSALQAASTYAVYLSTYNYTNLTGPTAPWTEVDQHSTAAFKSRYDKTKAALAKLVQTYKVTANGVVKSAGATSVTTKQAQVLIFLDQTLSNSTQSGTKTQPFVVELTLARQAGHWLIADFNTLQ
jgi:Mce-associated membrane protein